MAMKTTRFDPAGYMDSDEGVGAYLEEALETGDSAFGVQVLGTVTRARGMSQIAKEVGLLRESLYKALGAEGNPKRSTVSRVMQALGLRLSVTAADPRRRMSLGALHPYW